MSKEEMIVALIFREVIQEFLEKGVKSISNESIHEIIFID